MQIQKSFMKDNEKYKFCVVLFAFTVCRYIQIFQDLFLNLKILLLSILYSCSFQEYCDFCRKVYKLSRAVECSNPICYRIFGQLTNGVNDFMVLYFKLS